MVTAFGRNSLPDSGPWNAELVQKKADVKCLKKERKNTRKLSLKKIKKRVAFHGSSGIITLFADESG